MGIKKRDSNSDEIETQIDTDIDEDISKCTKKKITKGQGKDVEMGDVLSSLPSVTDSIKPMERKKKRKLLDKERHIKSKSKDDCVKNKSYDAMELSHTEHKSAIPEFHIGVFNDLVSSDASVRKAAAQSMVTELLEVQKAYTNIKWELDNDELQLEAEKDDGLNNCAPELRYAIRRLIRGVSSSRECARQGFGLGLTILIYRLSCIKLDSLLKLAVDLLEVSSSMKGQEIRDCLLGRLFAYGAIARSGKFMKEWSFDKNTAHIKDFINLLISLASKKRYLQDPAVAIILELVEQLPEEALLNHVVEASSLQKWFEEATKVGNTDALLLALKLRGKLSDDFNFGMLLPSPFSLNTFFSADHLASLVDCLKESTFCQPRIHGVWDVLVNTLLPDSVLQDEDFSSGLNSTKKQKKGRKTSSSEEETLKNFRCFCKVIIEGSLLLSSHDRKHMAFDVLLLLLPRLPTSFIPIVLSYRIVQCLIDILSTKNSWLYKVAQHFLKELSNWIKKDDAKTVSVIVSLQKHSNGKFDCLTRTKTVTEFIAKFHTESGCMLLIQNLMSLFFDETPSLEEPSDQSQTTDDNSEIGSIEDNMDSVRLSGNSDFLRGWVVESLPRVLKYLKLEPEAMIRVKKEILKFLTVQGIFSASLGTEVTSFELEEKFKWPKAATSSALCRMCIEQLQILLANTQKGEASNIHKAAGSLATESGLEVNNDLGFYFMRFLSTLRSIPSVSLYRPLSDEDQEALEKLQIMETGLHKEERNFGLSTDGSRLHAMRHLLIQLLLQMLLRPGEFSVPALELIICCKKYFGISDSLDSTVEGELGIDGPHVMDVLVDTMLSLLPQSSAPMRSSIEQVFKYYSKDVTIGGLRRMLRVIKRDLKPSRHLGSDSDEDSDDEDFLEIEEADESDEAETGETLDNNGQTDDSEAMLGTEESEKEIHAESEGSDGGMDDEAMFRMDSYLAHIIKERKNQVGGETAQTQFVLFKFRVLSLLEIFLHENPADPRVLLVYSNLAQAFVNPHSAEGNEQLEQRFWGILQKKIFKAKRFPKGCEEVQLSALLPLLEKNLKLASRQFKKKIANNPSPSQRKQSAAWNRHKMIVSFAQSSTHWILKIIDSGNFPESELQKVHEIFTGVLTKYFDSKKCQLKSEFLKEIISRRPWIGHRQFGLILEKCSGEELEFRRVEGLVLIIEILKSQVCRDGSKGFLKSHVSNLCRLINKLVKNMPKKASRRADIRKFFTRIFSNISTLNLNKLFRVELEPEAIAAYKSQLGDKFNSLENEN